MSLPVRQYAAPLVARLRMSLTALIGERRGEFEPPSPCGLPVFKCAGVRSLACLAVPWCLEIRRR